MQSRAAKFKVGGGIQVSSRVEEARRTPEKATRSTKSQSSGPQSGLYLRHTMENLTSTAVPTRMMGMQSQKDVALSDDALVARQLKSLQLFEQVIYARICFFFPWLDD